MQWGGARGLRLLTAADLTRLGPACPGCRVPSPPTPESTWAVAAQHRWGFVGVGTFAGEDIVGYALVAPSLHVPRSHAGFGRFYADPNAAVLLSLRPARPDTELRRSPLAALELLAARLRRAPGRPVHTLESLATVGGRPDCVAPSLQLLEASGFRVVDAHPTEPVCRLDLRVTILSPSWREVRERIRRAARRSDPRPQPASRQTPG